MKKQKDVKAAEGAVTFDDAEFAKEEFREKWDKKYPNIIKSWDKNWAELTTFFEYALEYVQSTFGKNMYNDIENQRIEEKLCTRKHKESHLLFTKG